MLSKFWLFFDNYHIKKYEAGINSSCQIIIQFNIVTVNRKTSNERSTIHIS